MQVFRPFSRFLPGLTFLAICMAATALSSPASAQSDAPAPAACVAGTDAAASLACLRQRLHRFALHQRPSDSSAGLTELGTPRPNNVKPWTR